MDKGFYNRFDRELFSVFYILLIDGDRYAFCD